MIGVKMKQLDYFFVETGKIDIYLCLQDTAVLRYSGRKMECEVFREDLLPYGMRGLISSYKAMSHELTYDSINIFGFANTWDQIKFTLISWFAGRVLRLDRKNAKKILNTFGFPQQQSDFVQAGISLYCRGLTLKDDYWIRREGETLRYSDVDLKFKNLSEDMAMISLIGASRIIRGEIEPQDIGTRGCYPKAWMREEDGVYLYKAGMQRDDQDNGYESLIEISISNILDQFNVRHLKYEKTIVEGEVCCKCKCMSTPQRSIVHVEEVKAKITREGKDFIDWVSRDARFSNDFHQMNVVDYLIENPDRHEQNWGFYMENKTGDLTKLHPLYDHNNAFYSKQLHLTDGGSSYIYKDMSKLEVAKESFGKCDIQLQGRIKPEEFVKDEHMQVFCDRMSKLGMKFKYSKSMGITPS
jgi:hypothetical protein